MIKLIKLLINFTKYLQFKEHLAATIVIIQGKSLNLGQFENLRAPYPKTSQDTIRHTRTLRDSIICIYSIIVVGRVGGGGGGGQG